MKKGHYHSLEAKKKISDALKGKKRQFFSEEHRRKLSEAQKGKKSPFFRKHHSKESKMKISEAHKGIKHSAETKLKIGLFFKGKQLSKEHIRKISKANRGKHKTEEIKLKISKANRGKHRTTEVKMKMSAAQKGTKNSFFGHKHKESFKRSQHFKTKERRRYQILPFKDTSIEVKIQNYLKQLNIDFLTHQYIKEIEHGYQCDILIPSMNLVIECDGDYWHKYPIGNDLDHIRTKELLQKGFKVLRLWEFEIKNMNINEFKNKIEEI